MGLWKESTLLRKIKIKAQLELLRIKQCLSNKLNVSQLDDLLERASLVIISTNHELKLKLKVIDDIRLTLFNEKRGNSY